MNLIKPRTYPERTLALPCELCGKEVTTVGMYLKAKAKSYVAEGYYSSCSIRLCKACIEEARQLFEEKE